MAQKTPTPLQDAIYAQSAVINQLANEHAELLAMTAVHGERLAQAHAELIALYAQQAAE